MFNIEKIKAQLIIGAIVAGVIVCLGLVAKHYYDANLLNEQKVNQLADANKELNKQITDFQELKKIDDETIRTQQASIDELRKRNEEQRTQTVTVVKKIVQKYEALPQTPENIAKRDVEISTVHINALWITYCDIHFIEANCAPFKKGNEK